MKANTRKIHDLLDFLTEHPLDFETGQVLDKKSVKTAKIILDRIADYPLPVVSIGVKGEVVLNWVGLTYEAEMGVHDGSFNLHVWEYEDSGENEGTFFMDVKMKDGDSIPEMFLNYLKEG